MRRRCALVGLLVLVAACGGTAAPGTSTSFATTTEVLTTTEASTTTEAPTTTVATLPGMPSVEGFRAAKEQAASIGGNSLMIDPADCRAVYWSTFLDLGSAYAVTTPAADGTCEVWLGGEMENPNYSGLPAMYCRFDPEHVLMLLLPGDGGPVLLDDPDCAPTGFEQGSPVDG